MSARSVLPFLILPAVAFCLIVGPALAQQAQPAAAANDTSPLAKFKAAGRDASLTVLSARLAGKNVRKVGDVVALMLERGGMQNLEIDAPEFQPAETAGFDDLAKALGEFVRTNPPKTDYVLFADFCGTPGKGVDEVRVLVVDRQGAAVWQDRQTPADADFKRIAPHEPMDCCVLAVERLRPVLGLDDPAHASAPQGKIAQHWAEQTGVPDEAERDALRERQQAFKKAAADSALLVYPGQAGSERSNETAANLAKLVNAAHLMKAAAADQGPELDVQGNMNEQKVLWDMARGVREYVRAHRPDAPYVLYVHYLMGTKAGNETAVGGVHFVVCDRDGNWVVVDFQNSHHDDFNAIKPKSREDCDRLVAKRLEQYCK